jgi:hypothetical protein
LLNKRILILKAMKPKLKKPKQKINNPPGFNQIRRR